MFSISKSYSDKLLRSETAVFKTKQPRTAVRMVSREKRVVAVQARRLTRCKIRKQMNDHQI